MRKMLMLSVAALLAACSSSGTTDPAAKTIDVRVVDDVGAGVWRMPVTALTSDGLTVTGVTRRDGTVHLGVAGTGVYQVSVTPREGYLRGTDPLVRTVSVDPTASASIQFQVSRAGISQAEHPPEQLWW
jgi:hypothetical protein